MAHFCSMKITQDVRDYAAALQLDDTEKAVDAGMQKNAREFRQGGSELYVPGAAKV